MVTLASSFGARRLFEDLGPVWGMALIVGFGLLALGFKLWSDHVRRAERARLAPRARRGGDTGFKAPLAAVINTAHANKRRVADYRFDKYETFAHEIGEAVSPFVGGMLAELLNERGEAWWRARADALDMLDQPVYAAVFRQATGAAREAARPGMVDLDPGMPGREKLDAMETEVLRAFEAAGGVEGLVAWANELLETEYPWAEDPKS